MNQAFLIPVICLGICPVGCHHPGYAALGQFATAFSSWVDLLALFFVGRNGYRSGSFGLWTAPESALSVTSS